MEVVCSLAPPLPLATDSGMSALFVTLLSSYDMDQRLAGWLFWLEDQQCQLTLLVKCVNECLLWRNVLFGFNASPALTVQGFGLHLGLEARSERLTTQWRMLLNSSFAIFVNYYSLRARNQNASGKSFNHYSLVYCALLFTVCYRRVDGSLTVNPAAANLLNIMVSSVF